MISKMAYLLKCLKNEQNEQSIGIHVLKISVIPVVSFFWNQKYVLFDKYVLALKMFNACIVKDLAMGFIMQNFRHRHTNIYPAL